MSTENQSKKKRRRRASSVSRCVKCVVCGKEFLTRHSRGRYCSKACRREGERESWRAYGEKNRCRRRSYHRGYYVRNREAVIAKTKEYQKTMAGRAANKNSDDWQKEKAPHKIFARQVVRAAIVAGYMKKKPCVICGDEKSQAHHPDYLDPFRVIWLCRKHHDLEHLKKGESDVKETETADNRGLGI